MTEPRKPTSQEKEALAFYVAENYLGGFEANDHLEQANDLVENAAIAVFDEYVTGGPGWAGKVLMVIWDGSPNEYQLFRWEDGQIESVGQDPEFSK